METEKSVQLQFECPYCVGFDHKISFQALCLMEWEMDSRFDSIIQELRQTRHAMTKMALLNTDCGYELSNISSAAKKAAQRTMFQIRRYYDVKEEAIRLKHQWELAKLKRKQHNILIYYAKLAALALKQGVKTRVTQNASHRDRKVKRLHGALDKLEMHRLLLLLGDTGISA